MGSIDMEEALLRERRSNNLVDHGNQSDESSAPPSVTSIVIFSTFVAVLGSFNNGYAAAFTSSAEDGIIKELGLSLPQYSIFGSISSIGSMIGALFSGKLADFIGRKATMWLIDIFCILGWLSIFFAKAAWMLDLGKLLLGIGIGLQCFVAPVYIGEIAPKSIRGACTFANEFMATVAMSMMYFVGNLIPWRILAAIGVAPCILQVLGLFFIPESPRWLVSSYLFLW
ncbi:hypothetical protein M9H77_27799 [Catharanthus roseus]|uniref:Uncharacterized protein n=1 Tax=Catharanthus roseus TaxID=4058 RepID=A0ACC0AE51_CATRO|nr:hypothetical protein M9H77_27799 [Catharanthus roseus]